MRKQRPGDILVFAEEMPNSILEFEALRAAADALLKMRRPRYALEILEQARKLDPDDVKARQLEGMALGRADRFAEAREALRGLAEEKKDGETLGIFAAPGRTSGIMFGARIRSARPIRSQPRATRPRHCKAPPPLMWRRFAPRRPIIIRASTR
jgi:tetratricopeptide (TPR) repeat protein